MPELGEGGAVEAAAREQRRTIYACGCVFDAIESKDQHAALNCPVHGSIWVEKKPLAALPEPPLDEWLSGLLSLHAIVGAIETSSEQRPLPLAQRIQRALLEALVEHRKGGQHGN